MQKPIFIAAELSLGAPSLVPPEPMASATASAIDYCAGRKISSADLEVLEISQGLVTPIPSPILPRSLAKRSGWVGWQATFSVHRTLENWSGRAQCTGCRRSDDRIGRYARPITPVNIVWIVASIDMYNPGGAPGTLANTEPELLRIYHICSNFQAEEQAAQVLGLPDSDVRRVRRLRHAA